MVMYGGDDSIAIRPHGCRSGAVVRWADERAGDRLNTVGEGLLQLMVEHAPVGVALLDRDLRYVAASRRWSEMMGLVGIDLLGRRHYDLFPDVPERWREAHRRALAGEASSADEDR
jgi:two-component system sensor histidine kinase/response regulator